MASIGNPVIPERLLLQTQLCRSFSSPIPSPHPPHTGARRGVWRALELLLYHCCGHSFVTPRACGSWPLSSASCLGDRRTSVRTFAWYFLLWVLRAVGLSIGQGRMHVYDGSSDATHESSDASHGFTPRLAVISTLLHSAFSCSLELLFLHAPHSGRAGAWVRFQHLGAGFCSWRGVWRTWAHALAAGRCGCWAV